MSTNIILKKSSVVGKVPTANDLKYGELALNYTDGRLYYKSSNNAILNFFTTSTTSTLYVNNSSVSTSTTTGALVVSGGAGIGGDLRVGGQLYINGINVGYGYTGSIGFTGSIGYTGSRGVTGFTGSLGDQGVIGYTGSQGFTGSRGVIGFTGSQGSPDTANDVLTKLLTVDGVGSGLDADLLDGQHGSYYRDAGNLNAGTILPARFLESTKYYEFDPSIPDNGVVNNHLAMPSIGQAAIEKSYMENKMQFAVPNIVEYSTNNGSTWAAASYTSDQLKDLMKGRYSGSGIDFERTWTDVRFTWDHSSYTFGYVFLNVMHLFYSTQGNSITSATIESKDFTTQNWQNVTTTGAFSGWPSHAWIPHSNIAYTASAGRNDSVRLTLKLNFTHASNKINLSTINWWGSYPASTQARLFSWDRDGQINFTYGNLKVQNNLVWHAGNDGSGSTLDADLLDGQEGSYYRNANNLNAGTVATARLGSGTANTTTWLRGDGSWQEGPLGYTGSRGTTGFTGSKGDQGVTGFTGSRGFTGSQGIQGVTGFTGSQGIQGVTGFTGSQGIQGVTGFTGSRGVDGFTGSRGFTGSIGFTGSQGIQGVTGFTGSQGIQGVTGFTGSQGIQGVIGYTGSRGATGFTGSLGDQGVIGYTGSRGSTGFTGSLGYTGSQGIIGFTGSQGISGASILGTNNTWTGSNSFNLDVSISGALNFVPTSGDVIEFGGSTFIKRLTTNGGARIGKDDCLILGAGEAVYALESNITHSDEVVAIGAENGVRFFSFPNNDTTWSNRKEMVYNLNGSLTVPTDIRAPVFYDSADTNFYTDPASTSILSALTVGGDNRTVFDFRLQRLLSGTRAIEHRFAAAANSPWYLYGQNLTWTAERTGTVESTQASRPYYEAYSPVIGYKEFGFVNVTSGNFTGTNLIPNLVLTSTGNVGIGTTSPDVRLDTRGAQLGNSAGSQVDISKIWASPSSNNLFLFTSLRRISTGTDWTGVVLRQRGVVDTSEMSYIDMILPGVGGMAFGTGFGTTAERMRINSAGDVGIGTTSPAARLHIGSGATAQDTVYISASLNGTGRGVVIDSNTRTSAEEGVAALQIISRTNTPTLFVTVGGNIGIGTTSTSAPLSFGKAVYGAPDNENFYRIKFQDVGGINNDTGIGQPASECLGYNVGPNGYHAWYAGTNGERMRLVGTTGNVGIGTTSPSVRLSVAGSTIIGTEGSTRITINGAGGAVAISENYLTESNPRWAIGRDLITGEQAGIGFGDATNTIAAGGSAVFIPTTRTLAFATSNGTSLTERMRITSAGNVGIGTTSPASILTINAATPDLIVNGTGQSNYGVKIRYNGSTTHGLHLTYTPSNATAYVDNTYIATAGQVYGDIYFRQNVSSVMTTRMTIKADGGNVGIGTTTPAYKLEVNGSFAATTKSFLIDHPSKPGKKLQHGSLEGPENGVYFRGRAKNQNKISYPDYWENLVDFDTITVHLTAVGDSESKVEEIDQEAVWLTANSRDVFYMIYAERKDVAKLEVEI